MTLELVPLGRCTECNEPRWRTPVCVCGDSISVHNLGKRAGVSVRTDCSHHGCSCKQFTEAA